MGDELNDGSNVTGEFRRKRPVPLPMFQDRFIERPYMRKEELSLIRNNLETLVDIKAGSGTDSVANSGTNSNPIVNKIPETKIPEIKINETKVTETKVPESKIVETKVLPDIKLPDTKFSNTKLTDVKLTDTKLSDTKLSDSIGIGNLVDNKKKIKRKVIKMADDEQVYNLPPEMRKQIRKSEMDEYHNEKEVQSAMKKAAQLAEENKKELEELKRQLAEENKQIKAELKSEFGSKFNDINGKFNEVTGRFDKVSTKLEETCTGIDCLKKDLANMNKNMDLVECPECGKKVVPPLSSYCPNCNAKMYTWSEDDGTPVKGWKPSWAEK